MFCTKCGNKVDEKEKFCTKCGAKIEQQKKSGKEKTSKKLIFRIGIILFAFIVLGCLIKKQLSKEKNDLSGNRSEEALTEALETGEETKPEEEIIDYSEKYHHLVYEEIGVVTEKKIQIQDEDIVLKDGFYHVDNPNKESYYGIVGSKLTDLNQDGKKEVFAACLTEEESGNEKELRIGLKEFEWDDKGVLKEKLPVSIVGSLQTYVTVRLWDRVDSEHMDYQHNVDWKVFYVKNGNDSYIVNVGKVEGKYKEEHEVSIYAIEETSSQNVYEKIDYRWDFTQNRPWLNYSENDNKGYPAAGENAFDITPEFYKLLNSMISTLAGYGINLSVVNDETVISYDNKCELIAEVNIQPNKLGEISGYKIVLNGNIIPADKEKNVQNAEIIDSVQNKQTESNRTTINYQREHEISEYDDLMLKMETCFWNDSFEDVNSVEDISSYIAYFVSCDYPYEVSESWYNTETGVYEISGEIVRKTMNKYFAFSDLKLEEHLPITPNHGQGNYWYDKENDMYYGWIGGFGGIHDGYQEINFEILDYGIVKAVGTWTLEDGSMATTEIVVEESEDGLMRLKAYKHSVGEPVEYSLTELEQMALDYRKRHGLYECKVAVDSEEGDMVIIHCYDIIVDDPVTGEGHTATSDWYTVNRYTAIGTNDVGEYIDLKN